MTLNIERKGSGAERIGESLRIDVIQVFDIKVISLSEDKDADSWD